MASEPCDLGGLRLIDVCTLIVIVCLFSETVLGRTPRAVLRCGPLVRLRVLQSWRFAVDRRVQFDRQL
jgi:hypothetical protein